jgi:hypothetical protein
MHEIDSGNECRIRSRLLGKYLARFDTPSLSEFEKPVKGCTHYVYEGEASRCHFNDTATKVFEEAGLTDWIGCYGGGIMGHVILCNPAE